MQHKQLYLSDRPLRQNKAFLKALYGNHDLENAIKWFDKRDYAAIRREFDKGMTLDSYLRLMTPSFHAVLQIGSPDLDKIRCCTRGDDRQEIERFLWIIAPFTEQNYGVVSQLFRRIYRQELESIPGL